MRIMKLTAEEMLNKFSKNTTHPIEVRRIALMLFEEASKKLFEMTSEEREYLKASALLHDITSRIELQVLHGIISLGVIGFRVKIALAATQRWQTVLSLSSAVSDSWSTAKDCLPSLIAA